jgi:Protein of unknown function (DUF3617)
MMFAKVLWSLVFLSVACAADGQALKQRKPGLWEIQYMGEDSASNAEQSKMADRLKNMPPEKRAQMEAYMKEHGVGMSAGPGGMPMMTMRVCLTPQDIADESGQGVMKSLKQNSACTTKVLNQSANEVHIAAHCSAQDGGWNDTDTRIFDITATHYSVEMKGNGARGEVHMHQQARWVGTDCKGAF